MVFRIHPNFGRGFLLLTLVSLLVFAFAGDHRERVPEALEAEELQTQLLEPLPEAPEEVVRESISIPEEAPPLPPTAPTIELRTEILRLEKRITWLEIELDLCGSEVTQGPIGRWLQSLLLYERPDGRTLRLLSEYLRAYPVELQPAEGLWVAERILEDDWELWGPTIDEAIILFLGPTRLVAELSEDRLQELREFWAEEGYFDQ